jgi:O-methyltransferase
LLAKRVLGLGINVLQGLFNRRTVELGNYDEETTEIIGKVRPYTMTNEARIAAVCDAISYVVQHGIPGDFVECGVWKGGSSMAAALRLLQLQKTDRALYLFDTFEGMTPPSDEDRALNSGFAAATLLSSAPRDSHMSARAPIDEVRRNMTATGYPTDRVHFVPGKVEDTLPEQAPESVAVLRLDTDWYSSTRHELVHLFPRLSPGGILIIDDYGTWQGAKKAVDEYFFQLNNPIFLHRIDYTGRIAVRLPEAGEAVGAIRAPQVAEPI